MGELPFECPHCTDDNLDDEDVIHKEYRTFRSTNYGQIRIQNVDDLSHQCKATELKELWYCYGCRRYFQARYILTDIIPLESGKK